MAYNDPQTTYRGPILREVPTLPEEDERQIWNLLYELADTTPEQVQLDALIRRIAGMVTHDPRTAEQKDLDEWQKDCQNTYNTFLP